MVWDGWVYVELRSFLSFGMVWNMDLDSIARNWGGEFGRTFICLVHDGPLDWAVVVEWAAIGGQLAPQSVTITSAMDPPHPVTPAVVGRIPLGTIQREARRLLVRSADAMRPWIDKGGLPPRFARFMEDHVALADVATGPQRGTRLTNADLEKVAEVYRDAADSAMPVQQAVADAFHISVSTAAKRIMRARAAGLLDDIDAEESSHEAH